MERVKASLGWEALFELLKSELRLYPCRATIERVIEEWGSPDQLETWNQERMISGQFIHEGWLLEYAAKRRYDLIQKLEESQEKALLSDRADSFVKLHDLHKRESMDETGEPLRLGSITSLEIVAGPQPQTKKIENE